LEFGREQGEAITGALNFNSKDILSLTVFGEYSHMTTTVVSTVLQSTTVSIVIPDQSI
jgi:hypothetical protein